jgi:hypothetical protein
MHRDPGTRSTSFATAFAVIALSLLGAVAQPANAAGSLIIDAFRWRGPAGAQDEYIQVYNDSTSAHTVAAISGTGYAIAASDGVVRCTIPNGTVIPARGHFLCVNSATYSIGAYPAGNGTTATGDATYTADIPGNTGIALFNNNTGGGSFTLANRFDAVGTTAEANTLYKEGTGLATINDTFNIDYSWVRDQCGRNGAVNVIGACPVSTGTPIDTDDNAADFYFVDTNGTSAGGGQRLGTPGPQNLSSPIYNAAPIANVPVDTCAGGVAAPNVVRDFTSVPANNSTFGTVDIRRTFTNNTGAPLTRLRFRIIDLDTFPAASGFADMRPITSASTSVTVDRPPCGSGTSSITVQGTTLEQPPSQPNGGGFYSSMSVAAVTAGTPLANGASIDVRFVFGIQQAGTYRVSMVPEALPEGGGPIFQIAGCTEGCAGPTVTINQAAAQADPTAASPINFTVVFSAPVTEFSAAGVTLGGTAGATTAIVTGSGTTYNVAVSGMTGVGTVAPTVNAGSAIDATSGPNSASTSTDNTVTFQAASPPHSLTIDAFRVRGPSGAQDEYVQVYNDSATAHTVTASSGTGYAIAASDGVVRCSIPNATVIPARGHFLCANSVAYSIGAYPAGNGTTATGDATFTTDIPDNAGIALFNTNVPANFAVGTRLDAVGSTAEVDALYREGAGLPTLSPFSIDYSWVRDQCGRNGQVNVVGACPVSNGTPIDTDDNAADFYFVDTNGTSAGGGQRLGTPGPQNLSSPIYNAAPIANVALDTCSADTAAPNVVRDLTSVPANNSTFGTVDIRRTFTNNTGVPLTRLRFRIIDLDTFPAASGFADMRPFTSASISVTVDRPPCGSGTSTITVQGTTLETPPSQPNGTGFYGTLSVPSVTLGTPLANGASVDVRFLIGLQQTGTYRLALVPEALPEGGGPLFQIAGCTEGCVGPTVTIDQAAAQADPAATSPINFTVVFASAVTGFTAADVTLGGTAGATTAIVSGGPTTYNVAVSGMTGAGTVIASIPAGVAVDALSQPNLASTSTDNTVTFAPVGPTVTINQAAAQVDPTAASPINFTVVFSSAVTGFTAADVTLGGTAGATTAIVTGGPATYNVAVSGMTANGTVIASIAAGVAVDALSTPNAASTSTDNTVSFTGIAPVAVTTFSGPSATGSGTITASFTGGSPTCTFSAPAFIAAPPGAAPVPPVAAPGGVTFPHGLFDFNLTGCTAGSTMSFTIVYPAVLPAGTQYWKYGPTSGTPAAHWYVLPATIVGNTATFTITDGGAGDDDLTANGTIVDQGGPGVPPAGGGPFVDRQVPTLDPRGMVLLALMLLGMGMFLMRRRQ